MIVSALTGSIGMGKSTALAMFADLGAATWSADAATHRLYARGGGAVAAIGAEFPGAVEAGAVDREKLSALVLDDAKRLARLEAIVHPLVAADRDAFLDKARKNGARLAVLDIPLFFETGAETAVDAVIVVTAPADIQRARVMARPGMSAEKLKAILARQTPDAEKRARADYVVSTGQSFAATRQEIETVIADLEKRFGDR